MKTYIIVLLILVIAVTTSCKRDPLPKNALSKKKFTAVLLDVQLAESMFIERNRVKPDTLKSEQLLEAALKKNGVKEEDFLATTLYYSRNPREYDKILSDILNKLNAMNEDLNPEKPLDVKPEMEAREPDKRR